MLNLISALRRDDRHSCLRHFVIVVAVAFMTAQPKVKALTPEPDGGYPNANTAEGDFALQALNPALGDGGNTAVGYRALYRNGYASHNTAVGSAALSSNIANSNTATGFGALYSNRQGTYNTADGDSALTSNIDASYNTATGARALVSNQNGGVNVATGYKALETNVSGFYNVANGAFALLNNSAGSYNVATGASALNYTTGSNNTATGHQALQNNTTGGNNVALGYQAGNNLTSGSNNIVIGAGVLGKAGESNTTRIGRTIQAASYIGGIYGKTVASASGVAVRVDASGRLGTVLSSARYKDNIRPMDKSSEAILQLEPVTFHYKKDLDPDGVPQFGLIAEQVEKVDPGLVVRDGDGKVSTVRYEAVNAMLLNEFLKEHRRAQDQVQKSNAQETTISELNAVVAKQQREINTLSSKLQKVSDRLELARPKSRLATKEH